MNIKFKVWDKHAKKWDLENNFFIDKEGKLYLMGCEHIESAEEEDYEIYLYTGLKDKKGDDIYESVIDVEESPADFIIKAGEIRYLKVTIEKDIYRMDDKALVGFGDGHSVLPITMLLTKEGIK